MGWVAAESNRSTFLRMLSPGSQEKILDIGAGSGRIAEFVRRVGRAEVYALDPNRKKIESMRKNYPDIKGVLSSSDSIPYPDAYFDKVYSTMAVHHFPDQPKSFSELGRVLKPGGSLVIVDISAHTLPGRLARFFENGLLRSHLTLLSIMELKEMLERDGAFDVRETEQHSSTYFVWAVRRGPSASP